MKEIKFRGKRVDNGKWIYGHLRNKESEYDDGMFKSVPFIYDENQDYMISHEVIPETVGQYTGLKDIKGKEIYEGDILGGIFNSLYIRFCDNCKQYQLFSLNECMACNGDIQWSEFIEELPNIEIIGNVYENKELLS